MARRGAIRVVTNGQTLTVTMTRSGGAVTPTAYTTADGSSTISLPAEITADTTFYLAAPETYSVSVKLNGVEIADSQGGAISQNLTEGAVSTIAPSVDGFTERASVDRGTYVSFDLPVPAGGSTADTAAVQAVLDAVSAAGGGRALGRKNATYLIDQAGSQAGYPAPTGTFTVPYGLKLPNNVTLDLNGSTLKLKAGNDAALVIHEDVSTPTDIGIVNGTLDGNDVLLTGNFLIQWGGVTRPTLDNLRLVNGKHGFVQMYDIDGGYFDRLYADTCVGQPFSFGQPQSGQQVRNSHFGLIEAVNITAEDTGTFPGNVFYGELHDCTIGTLIGRDSACSVKFGKTCADVMVDKIEVDNLGDAQNNTGVKFQGDDTDHPTRISVGSIIAKDQVGNGLYFEKCIDCTVGVYSGSGNGSGSGQDVWLGGTRDHIGVCRSDASDGMGINFRDYGNGANIDHAVITNPTGYGVSCSMVSGTRHRIGQLDVTDDRGGSAALTRGLQVDGTGGVLELGRRKISGFTTSAINVSAGGARITSPGGERGFPAGVWMSMTKGSNSTATLTNNQERVGGFKVERRLRVLKLAIEVTTAGEAGSTFIPTIRADDGAGHVGPALLIGSALDTSSTGVKQTTAVDVTLEPGYYYFGGVQQGATTTPAVVRCPSTVPDGMPLSTDTTAPGASALTFSMTKSGVSGTPPTDFASTAISGTAAARILVLTGDC